MVKVRALELASWGSQSYRHRGPKGGVIAGTDVPYTPPQRPRMHTSLLTLAALCGAVALAPGGWVPPPPPVPHG
ncbi:MAG: hypothetical protein ABR885_13640 [Mycobacterium sp.]